MIFFSAKFIRFSKYYTIFALMFAKININYPIRFNIFNTKWMFFVIYCN